MIRDMEIWAVGSAMGVALLGALPRVQFLRLCSRVYRDTHDPAVLKQAASIFKPRRSTGT